MALSTNTYIYAGGSQTFVVNFALGFIQRSDVKIRVNGAVDGAGDPVYAAFDWIDDSNVVVTDTLTIGDSVLIERTVSKTELKVNFAANADVTPSNLDLSAKHGLMLYQELVDGRVEGVESPITAADRAVAAAAQASAAAAAALVSETGAADDLVLTNADVVSTAADAAATADKLPKSGGTMTGSLYIASDDSIGFGTSQPFTITHDSAANKNILKNRGTSSFEIRDADDNTFFSQSQLGYVKIGGGTASHPLSVEGIIGAVNNTTNYSMTLNPDTGLILANGPDLTLKTYGSVRLLEGSDEKLATTATGVDVTGEITADGIALGDSQKATFGNADDLQIYHDGSNSYIKDSGTGSLKLEGTNIELNNGAGSKTYMLAVDGGMVQLRYDDAAKLSTTATGVDITGTVTADGLVVASTGNITLDSGTGETHNITLSHKGSYAEMNSIEFAQASTTYGNNQIKFLNMNSTGSVVETMRISGGGDISFYEDTGTTPKFFWDASAESLGIGTSSPDALVHAYSTSNAILKVEEANGYATLQQSGVNTYLNNISSGGSLILRNGLSATERLRIDSTGDVLVGTTNNLPAIANVEGIALSAGSYGGRLEVSRDSNEPMAINRMTTDGSLVAFKKDGTTVGSIGAVTGVPYITGVSRGIRFNGNNIRPCSTGGANLDDTISLGDTGQRFKDLYLSGGVYLGGTGAANLLDDYEEGTWTPQYTDKTNDGTMHSDNAGLYTKVGNMVTVIFRARCSSLASMSGQIYIAGLPFTPESSAVNKVAGGSASYYVLISIAASEVPLIRINGGDTDMQLTLTGGTTGTGSFVHTNLTDSGLISGSFSYIAA